MSDTEENPRKRQRLETMTTTEIPNTTDTDINMSEPNKPLSQQQAPAMTQTQQEEAVGITAYISPQVPGFGCVVKQRYTDFLVHEILPSGEVLHLSDLGEKRSGVKGKDGDVRAKSKEELREGGVGGGAEGEGEVEGIAQSNGAGDSRVIGEDGMREAVAAAPVQGVEGGAEEEKPKDAPAAATNGATEASAIDAPSEDAPAAAPAEAPTGMHPSRAQAIQEGASDAKKARSDALKSISEADRDVLLGIFGEITTESVIDLFATIMANPGKKPRDYPSLKSEVISDKSKRTEAHVACRRIFNSKLETAMVQDSPGTISIKAAPLKGNEYHRSSRIDAPKNGPVKKGKLAWDDLGGPYLHFSLYKENKDTMEVLYYIGSQLKTPAKNFQFAGTKDRRGATVQRVCIFRVHADRIAKLNKQARGWKVGGFEYKQVGLDLGELTGNEFVITLRDCHFDGEEGLSHDKRLDLAKSVVSKAADGFQTKGFLNYYGLQRFGSFAMGTHAIGLKMLQGNLEAAVDSILAYNEAFLPEKQDPTSEAKIPGEDIARADAIRNWRETGKSGYAIDHLPRRFQAEVSLIQYLGHKDKHSGNRTQANDWQGALMSINRPLRLMYVHAYQSLVFNTVAAKRWELYGDKVIEGDLVIVGTKEEQPTDTSAPKEEVDDNGEPIILPAEDDVPAVDAFTRARPLTKSEAESGRFDIFDVVLPLPGWDVEYPVNKIGAFYKDFMASETGGRLDPYNMRRAWKDISLSGDYRKMMSKPGSGFCCEVREYVDENEQMVETDLEKLQKPWQKRWTNFQAKEQTEIAAEDGEKKGEGKVEVNDKDKKVAVVVRMQLGSSQYATMALRELCKGGAGAYKPEWSAKR